MELALQKSSKPPGAENEEADWLSPSRLLIARLARGRSLRVVQHFELVFPDLDVDGPGLLLDKNAVDAEIL